MTSLLIDQLKEWAEAPLTNDSVPAFERDSIESRAREPSWYAFAFDFVTYARMEQPTTELLSALNQLDLWIPPLD